MSKTSEILDNVDPLAEPPALPPPFILVPNVHNFRTLGSHALPSVSIPPASDPLSPAFNQVPPVSNLGPSTANRRTRADFIYRSAELSTLTADGVAALHALDIRTIYDLRSRRETSHTANPHPLATPGIERVMVPVYPETDVSPPELAKRLMDDYGDPADDGSAGFARAYANILATGAETGAFRRVLEHVRDRPRAPFLVHCTAGKDRTGLACALALSVAGVGDGAVADEYALTEAGLGAWMPRVRRLMMRIPEFEGDEVKIRQALGARREYMMRTLEDLRARWGGAEGYLKDALGFSPEDVERIKMNLTEPAPEAEGRP